MKTSGKKILTAGFFSIAILAQTTFLYGFSISYPDAKNFNFELNPGETAQGTFTIDNNNNNKVSLKLYGADAVPSGTATFAAKSDTDKQLTMGKWINFPENAIDLNPDEKRDITFQVIIPDKTPPGTYAGAVAIATAKPAETPKTGGIGLMTSQRNIFAVYVKVPGVETHSFEWRNFSFGSKENPLFRISLKNTGNTLVSANGKITIFDAVNNKEIHTQEIKNTILYQGDETTLQVPFDKKLAGGIVNKYKAVATLDFSKVDIVTGKNAAPQTLTKEVSFEIDHFESIYIALTAIIVLLAVIIVTAMRKRKMRANAKQYTVGENENIESIAEKENISWKKIARLNRLKQPYFLKSGTIILIPQKK